MKKQQISAVILGIFVGLVLWLTVVGREPIHTNIFLFKPLHSFNNIIEQIKRYGIHGNFLGNILMFIPIGFLYPMAFSEDIGCTVVFGCVLTVSIECSQLILSYGFFEVDDIICNLLGAMIGWLMLKVTVLTLNKKSKMQ